MLQKVGLPPLTDGALLKTEAYVAGEWKGAASRGRFAVQNPADGVEIAKVANCKAPDAQRAIEAARQALPGWRAKTAKERAAAMRRWFELILAHQEDLAKLMTAEQGKPMTESRGEIIYGASFIEWFAEEAKRVYGDTIPTVAADKRLLVWKEPIGVVAAITPWNFPNAMITRKVAPAIAAGCTVIVKPAEQTPLSALALAELAQRAGLPPGVFNVVPADETNSIAVGKALCESDVVRKLSFTGSTAVGRILMQQSAPTLKKLSLELGGNAPFIVFDDAALDAAVDGAVASKYRNAGQTCVCTNRFYVHEKVYDEFVHKLAAKAAQLKVGSGFRIRRPAGSADRCQCAEKSRATRSRCNRARRERDYRRRAPRSRRHFLSADRARRRHRQDAADARRNLRAGRSSVQVFRRRRSDCRRECKRVRAGRVFLFARRGACVSCRGSTRIRHGRRQHRPDVQRSRSVWRHQAVGVRARRVEVRDRRVSGDQVRVHWWSVNTTDHRSPVTSHVTRHFSLSNSFREAASSARFASSIGGY